MNGNEPYKVTSTREQLLVSDNGKVAAGIRVEFMVGDHGPFVEMFKKDDFTPMNVAARLSAFAQTVNQISGQY